MDLKNVNLLDLQTTHMKNDPTTQALCATLNLQFQQLAEDVKRVLVYSNIDNLDEEAVDELAWQLSLDWYNSNLDVSLKRNLVKNALRLYKKNGTPQAVLDAMSIVYGDASIEEWFEYNGEPFYFRINIDVSKQGTSIEEIKLLESLIDTYKNKRSWVEIINIFLTSYSTMNLISANINSEIISVYPWYNKESKVLGSFFMGIGSQILENITVYPGEV